METPAGAEILRERLRLFLAELRPRLAGGENHLERLSQLRSLSDIRIRTFSLGRPKVTGKDLCALLADPKAGRFDTLAVEHGLLDAPHLETSLEPLGETMGCLVEACLSLQVLGTAATREALAAFSRRHGPVPVPGPARPAQAAAAAPPPPRPLPPAVQKILGGVKGLWTPPPGLRRILEMTGIPGTPVDKVSGEIERDPPLAAELLRTLNTLSGAGANSVKRAIVMLGYADLRRLVGPSAILARLDPPPAPFDRRAFWTHALQVAHAAMLVSRAGRLGGPEDHFLAGLLHDLGKLVVARLLPARFKAILDAAGRGAGFADAERECLGTDHAEIGACVAERWGLAPGIAEAARHHLEPPAAFEDLELPREAPVVAALCALSKDAARPAEWAPILRLPGSRLPEIRLQASRLAEDSLRIRGVA